VLAFLQFEEGSTPNAYAFALVEQRGGGIHISLRTFVAGEIQNLNVAKPVKSTRLQHFASIIASQNSLLWILKVSLNCFKTTAWVFHGGIIYWQHLHLDMPFSCLNLQVCSLSTIMREFTAMHSVASLPFKDLILSATEAHKDGDDQSRAWNVPEPLMDYLKVNLNDSQLEAVNVSILWGFALLVSVLCS
jgi:senataxin